jgi:hypothetical protein
MSEPSKRRRKKASTKDVASDNTDLIFVAARITAATHRKFKSFAAETGRTVQDLMEEALTEYLDNHRR